MRCACIDIGSNTTRVLVADVTRGHLREVYAARAFTRLGRELLRTGTLPPDALDTVATTVAEQLALARNAGAQRIRVVATAAIRQASNGDDLCHAVHARTARHRSRPLGARRMAAVATTRIRSAPALRAVESWSATTDATSSTDSAGRAPVRRSSRPRRVNAFAVSTSRRCPPSTSATSTRVVLDPMSMQAQRILWTAS